MSDLILMQVVYGLYHLLEHDSGVVFAETTSLIKSVEELPSLAETK